MTRAGMAAAWRFGEQVGSRMSERESERFMIHHQLHLASTALKIEERLPQGEWPRSALFFFSEDYTFFTFFAQKTHHAGCRNLSSAFA